MEREPDRRFGFSFAVHHPRFRTGLAFAFLCFPALLLAWFHYDYFPHIVVGMRHLWNNEKPFSEGFALLQRFGFIVYFLPAVVLLIYILSWRFAFLRDPLCVALCGSILAMLCIIYAAFLSTPALLYGL